MKKNYKDIPAYDRVLSEGDTYQTKPNIKRKRRYLPVTISFYIDLIGVVKYANMMAKAGVYDDYRWTNSSFDTLDGLEENGIKISIEGINNIRGFEGPAIFIANHMSTLETFILPSIINPIRRVVYIIKKELADFPLFGPVATARDPIIVGRKNPREDLMHVITEGKKLISSGRSIIVFPQKTRSSNIDFSSFNSMGIKLAKQNNIPVVPIALLTDAWGNGKKLKDFGKIDPSKQVYFSFGKPISVENPRKAHEYVIEFIKEKFNEWGKSDYIIG